MSPKLSIIIVNWNGIAFLPNCLKSIVDNPPGSRFEIIVVDNDSSDGSPEWIKSNEAAEILGDVKFTLIESGGNLGFSKANNLAIEKTKAPFVFLLNPDTLVKSGAIDKLLETVQSASEIGACAPKLLNQDGSVQHNVWGFPPTPLSILILDLQFIRFLPKKLLGNVIYSSFWDYSRRVDVPIVSGAAIMAKREMIEEVGGLDPSYHMYGEDVEWCARINKAGWKVFFEPEAEIYHIGGQSSVQRWGNAAGVQMHESGMEVQLSCLPTYLILLNALTSTFTHGLFFLKNLVTGGDTTTLGKIIKIQLNGAKRSLSNRT